MRVRRRTVFLLAGLRAWAAKRLNGQEPKRGHGMADEAVDSGNGKGRKRVAVKPATRPAVIKVKSTIHLSVEASQRLDIHATMMGFDRSALVEKLINDHLRRYVVSDRRGSAAMTGDEEAA
jgi:hypothetical protein